MSKKIFGFIEKKIDFASAIALVISFIAGSYQLYWFLEESDVDLLRPHQVFFNKMERQRVRLVVPVTFVNKSTVQYNEVIRRVSLTAKFMGAENVAIDFDWRSFAAFDPLRASGKSLLLTAMVSPILVPGASSTSHEIEFYQPKKQCVGEPCPDLMVRIMTWDDFARLVSLSNRIAIEMTAVGVNGEEYETSCTLIIDDPFKKRVSLERPWHAPPCFETTSSESQN